METQFPINHPTSHRSAGAAYVFILIMVGLMLHSHFSNAPTTASTAPAQVVKPRLMLKPLELCGLKNQVGAFASVAEPCKPLFTFTLVELANTLIQAGLLTSGETLMVWEGAPNPQCPYLLVSQEEPRGVLCFTPKGDVYRSSKGDSIFLHITSDKHWVIDDQHAQVLLAGTNH